MSLDFSIEEIQPTSVFNDNYTHNVTPMWNLAGVYEALYESEDKKTLEIVQTLKNGLTNMLLHPDDFKKLNPENGWGDYDTAVNFLRDVIHACEKHPNGTIRISK